MRLRCLIVPLLLLGGGSSAALAAEEAPLVAVYAVRGQTAQLPCNLTKEPEDPVILMLWYKNGTKTPVFSMDSRARGHQQEWSDGTYSADASGGGGEAPAPGGAPLAGPAVEGGADAAPDARRGGSVHAADAFRGRASLRKRRWSWSLLLREVEFGDEGEYRCRLDFQSSPTHNARVLLHVVDLPSQLRIYSPGGSLVKETASVKEGHPLTLICKATGGEPLPNVTWWSGSALLDAEADDRQEAAPGAAAPSVTNTLHVEALTRAHLSQNLTCTASNTPALPPLGASLHLQETDEHLAVQLRMPPGRLSGGKEYDVTCEASGVQPPPVITWWLRGKRLPHHKEVQAPGSSETVSVLQLAVEAEDDGGVLECRAASPTLTHLAGAHSTTLTVHYVPDASISVEGASVLDEVGGDVGVGGLRAGDSATLTCAARANPPAYNFTFLFNGRPLHRANVVKSGPSLTLLHLDHRDVGLYTCLASNSAGDGQSNAVALHVDYPPVCEWEGARKVVATVGEKVEMECRVKASPPEVSYEWESVSFTPNMEQLRAPLHHKDSGLTSVGWVVADNGSSSGGQRAECQPSSEIGPADHPCVFTILLVEEPSPLIGCHYHDVTTDSAGVTCLPLVTSGHLPLTYHIEVREAGKVVAAYNSSEPRFNVTSLAPGGDYVLAMYATHAKGRGRLTKLLMKTFTPRAEEVAPERVSVNPVNSPGEISPPPTEAPGGAEAAATPVSVVVAGVVVGAVVGVAVVVAGVVACRAHAHSAGKSHQQHQHHTSSQDSLLELPPGIVYQSYGSHPSCELLTTFSPGPVVVTQVTPGRSGRRSLPLSRRSSTRSASGGRSPRPTRPRAFSCRGGGPVHVVEVESDGVTTPRVEFHSPSRRQRRGGGDDNDDPFFRLRGSSLLQLAPHVRLSPQSLPSAGRSLLTASRPRSSAGALAPYAIPQIQITPQQDLTGARSRSPAPLPLPQQEADAGVGAGAPQEEVAAALAPASRCGPDPQDQRRSLLAPQVTPPPPQRPAGEPGPDQPPQKPPRVRPPPGPRPEAPARQCSSSESGSIKLYPT